MGYAFGVYWCLELSNRRRPLLLALVSRRVVTETGYWKMSTILGSSSDCQLALPQYALYEVRITGSKGYMAPCASHFRNRSLEAAAASGPMSSLSTHS